MHKSAKSRMKQGIWPSHHDKACESEPRVAFEMTIEQRSDVAGVVVRVGGVKIGDGDGDA
jgi:hypothetical protein